MRYLYCCQLGEFPWGCHLLNQGEVKHKLIGLCWDLIWHLHLLLSVEVCCLFRFLTFCHCIVANSWLILSSLLQPSLQALAFIQLQGIIVVAIIIMESLMWSPLPLLKDKVIFHWRSFNCAVESLSPLSPSIFMTIGQWRSFKDVMSIQLILFIMCSLVRTHCVMVFFTIL